MNSLLRHIMGFGSIGESNPQSMHYKHVPFEDRVFDKPSTTEWVCDKGHRNIEYSKCITGRCRVCGEVDSMLRAKPHYKWSWKLKKAVRL